MIRHTLQVPWDTEYTTASEDNEVFQIAWNDQAMVLFMGTVSNGSKRIIRQCRRPARTATNVGDAVVMRGWARSLLIMYPALLAAATSPEMASAIINRPALGNFPQHDWASILRTGPLKVAPKGPDQVFTAMAGSDANEVAYKAAFMWKRRDVEFSSDEISSAMNNQSPGSPHMSILSFKSAFHGRLFGSLSTTRSKPIHKLDTPAFDWPQASFPLSRTTPPRTPKKKPAA